MNNLTISVKIGKEIGRAMSMGELLPDPIMNVVVRFCHRINGSRSSRSIIVSMAARQRGQADEALRCELFQSKEIWAEMESFGDDHEGEAGDEWTIQTIDPDGVLRWLGIDFETFKKYQQQNAEPLRLPAARFD